MLNIPSVIPRAQTRMSLASALAERERAGQPVRVGLIGAGQMGTDIIVQCAQMPGMRIVAVAEPASMRAQEAFAIAGTERSASRLVETDDADQAYRSGAVAITRNYQSVCEADCVDVVIDATGNPNVGANVAMLAIAAGKHIVMMNVEGDVTMGAYLAAQAREAGVVYTLGAGDEPTATMELVNFVRSLGYPIVAAGKGKNNPFRIDAMPADYVEEATRRNMNPRMLVEFVDGTKTMVEMVALANAAGLVPDVPGMHGPAAELSRLDKVLCPREEGGILTRKGVVDFSVAKGVAPGVFVVAEMRHPRIRERMGDLHLGDGPYYTFYRPYHLTSIEVPLSAAAAVLFGESHMCPLPVPTAEVGALAKRDIAAGETLDAIGETCYRGFALSRTDAQDRNALPLGLAQGARAARAIAKGDYLTYENCAPDESLRIVEVRRAHDAYVAQQEGRAA